MRRAALLLSLLFLPCPAGAAGNEGRVVAVNDGHTLVVLADNRRIVVRLAGIAAPTGAARYAIASRQALIAVCGGEPVRLEATSARGSGQATTARVWCNGADAAAEQLKRGMARLAADAGPDRAALEALEVEARGARRGIWSTVAPARPAY